MVGRIHAHPEQTPQPVVERFCVDPLRAVLLTRLIRQHDLSGMRSTREDIDNWVRIDAPVGLRGNRKRARVTCRRIERCRRCDAVRTDEVHATIRRAREPEPASQRISCRDVHDTTGSHRNARRLWREAVGPDGDRCRPGVPVIVAPANLQHFEILVHEA